MAIAQSGQVAGADDRARPGRVELVGITTFGDVTQAELAQIGGTGRVRQRAARRACCDGEVDLAVHSLKDLPTAPASGLRPGRGAAARRPAGRAGRPGRRQARRPAGRAPGSAPARRAGPPSCATLRPGPAAGPDPRQRGHPAGQDRRTARSTRSCWPTRAWPGSAGSTRSARSSSRTRCCPRPGRARWPWSAAPATRDLAALLARLDDPVSRAGHRRRTRPCWPRSRPGCSAPIGAYAAGTPEHLRLEAVGPAAAVGRGGVRDGTAAVRAAPPGRPPRPRGLASRSPPSCCAAGPRSHMAGHSRICSAAGTTTGEPDARNSQTRGQPARIRSRRSPAPAGSPSSAPGPGDEGLLTLRAAALLAEADLVVGRPDVGDAGPRACCGPDAEVTDSAGASAEDPKLLVKAAKAGRLAVRLYAGDPLLFCHAASDAAALRQGRDRHSRSCPACPSATAVPAYAGIPLTSDGQGDVRIIHAAEVSRCHCGPGQPGGTGRRGGPGRPGQDARSRRAGRSPTPFAITWNGTTTEQQTVLTTLGTVPADLKAAGVSPLTAPGPAIAVVGEAHRRAARAVLVRDQAAVRLAGAGAADQGAGRQRLRPAPRVRRGARAGADDRGRAAAHAAADGPGDQGPGHRPVSVGRLHLGQRGPRGTGEVRGVRPRRAGLRRGQGRRRRRADRGRAAGLRHHARPGARRRAVRRGAGRRAGRPTTTCSTRSTGCCCPAPTSPPRRLRRPADRAGLGGRGRHRLPHRPGRAAARADPRGDQGRRLRRRAVHLVLHGPQPDRHRGQAARGHGHRGDRAADRQDRGRVRAAGRRDGAAARRWPRWSTPLAEYGAGLRDAARRGRRSRSASRASGAAGRRRRLR